MQLQATTVWLATQPVDIRAGGDRLSLHVQQALGRPPCDGTAYVFSNRRHTRLKVVCWDGNGVWMCVRRLHRGQCCAPRFHRIASQIIVERFRRDWRRFSTLTS
ncbi:IS66 family insertion sequence element accessory protein TnpB [Pseudoduganella sp. R-34]|uniref:IS66 family insertion sequence element accessory protein TnpB n=1 Tax=unclassified Pseudoduganella TaxID=2637179 RepID=UPI003CEFAAA8